MSHLSGRGEGEERERERRRKDGKRGEEKDRWSGKTEVQRAKMRRKLWSEGWREQSTEVKKGEKGGERGKEVESRKWEKMREGRRCESLLSSHLLFSM